MGFYTQFAGRKPNIGGKKMSKVSSISIDLIILVLLIILFDHYVSKRSIFSISILIFFFTFSFFRIYPLLRGFMFESTLIFDIYVIALNVIVSRSIYQKKGEIKSLMLCVMILLNIYIYVVSLLDLYGALLFSRL
jgi:hypothetical protein